MADSNMQGGKEHAALEYLRKQQEQLQAGDIELILALNRCVSSSIERGPENEDEIKLIDSMHVQQHFLPPGGKASWYQSS